MLSRIEILFLASIFSFVLLSTVSFAAINCSPCFVNNCVCAIEGCASGILRIYSSAGCRTPTYEFTFSSSRVIWNAASAGTYYAQAFCSDGQLTTCNSFTVKTSETTTTLGQTTTTLDEDGTSGTDYSWIVILIGVLIVIVLVVFLFFRRKKQPKKSFETLYRKWGK